VQQSAAIHRQECIEAHCIEVTLTTTQKGPIDRQLIVISCSIYAFASTLPLTGALCPPALTGMPLLPSQDLVPRKSASALSQLPSQDTAILQKIDAWAGNARILPTGGPGHRKATLGGLFSVTRRWPPPGLRTTDEKHIEIFRQSRVSNPEDLEKAHNLLR